MSKENKDQSRDWRETLYLPHTDFPMRAGLPVREPEMLARWDKIGLYERLRADGAGREKFILHDGPPYANGHLHIGHALNKILKDVITRSQQMMGRDSNYVPGWDCHGLPIEWKIEEQYRAKGRDKDVVPVNEFRAECRESAEKWLDIQREEFKRLGIEGDWDDPYTTMAYSSEAVIANELMKFAMNGLLYRGSKPVMWSVVERTALAEAEVEYHEHTSPTIWVKFPIKVGDDTAGGSSIVYAETVGKSSRNIGEPNAKFTTGVADNVSVVIWTTTPWTIPGNRAISFSSKIAYGLYEVDTAENDFGPQPGEKLLFAKSLADACSEQAKLNLKLLGDVSPETLKGMICAHPLRDLGYEFDVPLLEGDHVTEEAGTGFVHTAPGHGRDDFDIWTENRVPLEQRGIDPTIPYTVGPDGVFTADALGFEGNVVINDKGKFGDANDAVIEALIKANTLFSRGRLKHDYPHSWRSKKPVIFRNTPQWFIAMDKDIQEAGSAEGATGNAKKGAGDSLRARALKAISETRWVPDSGENRITGMIRSKPDWVLSRQRAWGVPITVFRNTQSDEVIPGTGYAKSDELIARITDVFEKEGADAWFADGAKERFLDGLVDDPNDWEKVDDILDVWFDSGSTHSFVLEGRDDLKWPASLYLEGSDQHRGWFQSSLLESCGTRGRAPYEAVLTHGFVMAEDGRKMSKSLNNQVFPQDVIKQNGADILRLWVMSSDYADDLRIGPEILKSNVDAYRKLRNTFRFMLGNLHHYEPELRVPYKDMPELDRYILHRLSELDVIVRKGYNDFDFKRIFQALFNFCIVDLSAFYFDIRKDALYCDAHGSMVRRASLTVLDEAFRCLITWLAPMLCFTCEEVWQSRYPSEDSSVHLQQLPDIPKNWRDTELDEKWTKIRTVRRVVTGALEVERREKRIGSSLEAAPIVHIRDDELREIIASSNFAEIAITSGISFKGGSAPQGAFTLDDVAGVGVVPNLAEGRKCQRSWKFTDDVGSVAGYPELSARDAEAVRQFDARHDAGD